MAASPRQIRGIRPNDPRSRLRNQLPLGLGGCSGSTRPRKSPRQERKESLSLVW